MNPNFTQPAFGAIVLAAGSSSRMNAWKPAVRIGGIPLIVNAIVPAIKVCRQIIVVGGSQFTKLEQLVRETRKISEIDQQKIEIVENKKYAAGMFSSVKTGMVRADLSLDGVFVVPGDMPFITEGTYRALATSFQKKPEVDVFIPAASGDSNGIEKQPGLKKGHPILLRRRICASILQESDDSVLRDVLIDKSSEICPVGDKGILLDIDDEADLKEAEYDLNAKELSHKDT